MSGWAAYGYAKGIAKNGAKGYDSFLLENKTLLLVHVLTVGPITLENAANSAEYLAGLEDS